MKLNTILANKTQLPIAMLLLSMTALASVTILTGTILASSYVSATDDSVVDQVNITVPVSCTMTGTGMDSHNAEITNGTYTPNIGSTTLHAFCNDNEGFAIYAAGYTGNGIGGTNSNKLVGTNASSNATIVSGTATTAGNPDISNWAMKLAISQDSGDTTTNAFAIDSAPNVALPSEAEQGATSASFSDYHMVPNEYTKVAHKNSNTDMTATAGGVKLTTTYAAYISKTQPADTYSGQVIYTLVHPSNAPEPVPEGKVGVTYHANGSTFTGGADTNRVIYASSPMYIATTPLISKTDNVASDGTQNGSYAVSPEGQPTITPVTATGASKMKVVIRYGISAGTIMMVGDRDDFSGVNEYIGDGSSSAVGTATYTFDGDTVVFGMYAPNAPTATDGQDYGYFAEVYPVYATEQTDTEPSEDFAIMTVGKGTYAETTDWYGSWYADINGQHYEFTSEAEIIQFLNDNLATLSGTNIDLYRSLTINEAYAKANKSQSGGYYIQQDMNNTMCQTVAIGQNGTVKDIRDDNIYMIGRLKDGRCWMLDNLALDPTDSTTAANMNASNTNATAEAIANYLNGSNPNNTVGWSSAAVINKTSSWSGNYAFTQPWVNNQSKDALVTSYGPAATNGQAKVGLYYNYCAATVGTYCYAGGQGVDKPDTLIDADQDICPANWRMPTGIEGEQSALNVPYPSDIATEIDSIQYGLSTPLSGFYRDSSAYDQNVRGNFWSSTSSYQNRSYITFLYVKSTEAWHSYYGDRTLGYSIRCLVGD